MERWIMEWVGRRVADHRLAGLPVVEVGSLDVNGSVRPIFHGPYLGVDKREGPGVDRLHDIEIGPVTPTILPAVVVSTDMLEHTPRPWRAWVNMVGSLRPAGGHVLVTAAGFQAGEHDHGGDYWRFSPDGLWHLATDLGGTVLDLDWSPNRLGVYCHARFDRP